MLTGLIDISSNVVQEGHVKVPVILPKLCTILWSPYYGSSATLVQYNGVSSPQSNAKVIEILKKLFTTVV